MFEQVKGIIEKYTEVETITLESELGADLGLSSFDLVAVVSDFEDTFGLEVPDRDLVSFVTVQDILDYIQAHQA